MNANELTDILIEALDESARAHAHKYTTDESFRLGLQNAHEAGALRAWIRIIMGELNAKQLASVKRQIERIELKKEAV